jgi:predicted RNA binding protein YcfA (HicA-like mRNA interferase family)
MSPRKTLELILQGSRNVRLSDFVRLVGAFGFGPPRVSGSHHIFSRPGIPEAINVQDFHGQAKPYQIRQFLNLVEKYGLKLKERP